MQKAEEGDRERVEEALRLAGLYNKVMSLPKGMDTVLTKEFSEDGEVLSGGQYQKIGVARAFVRQCPVSLYLFQKMIPPDNSLPAFYTYPHRCPAASSACNGSPLL